MDSCGGQTETRTRTEEEEALKRNTDCVYFLASPLTCKKGNECEYRHSEDARLNPRDCYYWLKSNCLNPKCAFRHPPLDGLLGPPSSGLALPPTLIITAKPIPTAHSSPAYNMNKQSRSEPCIFFLKGHCLKGERCPFSHGPQAGGNVPQQVPKESPSLLEQSRTFKKESWGIKQCVDQQHIPKLNSDMALAVPVSAAKLAESPSSNGLSQAKNLLPRPLGNKLPRTQSAQAAVANSNTWSRSQDNQIHPSDKHLQNSLEPGEIVGEHSSGFDVHVANNVKDISSSHNENDLGRKSTEGGKKLDHFNDYDCRPSDYKFSPTTERNQYSGTRNEVERNGRTQERYDMRAHMISSERSLERSVLPERRVLQRQKSPDEVDRADLRHHLKKRKFDGSKSAISSDCHDPYRRDARYMEDKYHGHHSQRDQSPCESSLSARLQGRISLPGMPSGPVFHLQSTVERDASRHRGRTSPTRSISNQVRQYDRMSRLSEEPPLGASARSLGGRLTKKEDIDSLDFTGPKSLAELKGAKLGESSQEQSTKNICRVQNNGTMVKTVNSQKLENSSFDGPKPESLLLKRKSEDAPPIGGANSNNVDENDGRNGGEKAATADGLQISSVESNNEDSLTIGNFGATKAGTVEEDEDYIPSRDDELIYDGQSSFKEDMPETEDYMEFDAMEDQELQNYDHQDADESDYEATETGEFKTEYESQGEEEDESDDEEDFARKAGLMFS